MTVFLLSPARCDGARAAQLVRSRRSALGAKLRDGTATIGEVFTWLSALYFRGKLTYARRFGDAHIMAAGLGLCAPEHRLTADELGAMGRLGIDSPEFAQLLHDHAVELARGRTDPVVLLGSIATGKYTGVLLEVFGDRLLFPETFVGRGDMSRGGLLLRAARSGEELLYTKIAGAKLRGARPPKLARAPR